MTRGGIVMIRNNTLCMALTLIALPIQAHSDARTTAGAHATRHLTVSGRISRDDLRSIDHKGPGVPPSWNLQRYPAFSSARERDPPIKRPPDNRKCLSGASHERWQRLQNATPPDERLLVPGGCKAVFRF